MFSAILLLLALLCSAVYGRPEAVAANGVTYRGLYKDDVEAFLGIRFGLDTGGPNRFKPPRPYVPKEGEVLNATRVTTMCPQEASHFTPIILSEDCLLLNIFRPNLTVPTSKLPVMVWIVGGSLVAGSKDLRIAQPGGLILQSIDNGTPIIHAAMNYRLGVFGFPETKALREEGSLNAGLKDQRLALEWVQNNIEAFGGDPSRITVQGQSSGGVSIGFQTIAYGGTKPVPFQQILPESQILERGITYDNYTKKAMRDTVGYTGCNKTDLDSRETLKCLRNLSMDDLYSAQNKTTNNGVTGNYGDQWLPTVDGDFVPDLPSKLVNTGQFANVSAMMGWMKDDMNIFVGFEYGDIQNESQFRDHLRQFLPFSQKHLDRMEELYPADMFQDSHFDNGSVIKHSHFYRAGQIVTDVFMVCQPLLFGEALAKRGNDVYFYNFNQTVLKMYDDTKHPFAFGIVHASDVPYIFANFSSYNYGGHSLDGMINGSDVTLLTRMSRSVASFVTNGNPVMENKQTLKGWEKADFEDENFGVYVIGGPKEGYSSKGGNSVSREEMRKYDLKERCGFLNSPEVVKELYY